MADILLPVEPNGLAYVYIVWAFKVGDLRVVAICSCEEIAKRYTSVCASEFSGFRLDYERAPLDHIFGRSDLRSVAFRASMREARR